MAYSKDFTFPLRATLVSAVVLSATLSTFFTVGIVGIPSYYSAKKASQNLWMDLAKQSALTGEEQILRYFQSAPTSLKMVTGLIEEEALKINTRENIFDICYRTLKENPEFTTVYYTTESGDFFGVLKTDDLFRASFRTIGKDGKTRVEDYQIKNDQWEKVYEELSDYDPRKRPFWATGKMHPGGAWTDVYPFATTDERGYTFVLALMENRGVKGYWAVDFQINLLNEFIRSLNIGEHGSVYIIEDNGKIVAQTDSQIPSEVIDAAWGKLIGKEEKGGFVEVGRHIFYINRFPKESQIPWNLVTVIQENDFLVPVRNKATAYLAFGILPLLAFLMLSSLFFSRISNRLKGIAHEMDKVGELSLETHGKGGRRSRIKEINIMERSLQKMKIGIQSFSRYAPVDLVKMLLHSGKAAELGGEKRKISVFFADLSQFTSLSELMDADKTAEILKEFLSIASVEIHKEKGIIDKFMGDAVMALWGAPEPSENHELSACRAALSLKDLTSKHPMLKNKVGINSGTALVGNFGSEERMDYTAIGDAVNIAARLEKLNAFYGTTILIGEDTAQAVKDTFLIRPIDYVVLRGRKQSHLIYELIDEKLKATEQMLKGISTYESALKLYLDKKFVDAIVSFEKANQLFGGSDIASSILIKRCKTLISNPPRDDWNGVTLSE